MGKSGDKVKSRKWHFCSFVRKILISFFFCRNNEIWLVSVLFDQKHKWKKFSHFQIKRRTDEWGNIILIFIFYNIPVKVYLKNILWIINVLALHKGFIFPVKFLVASTDCRKCSILSSFSQQQNIWCHFYHNIYRYTC